jgi:hypothetical protein
MTEKEFQQRCTHWGQVLLKTELPENLVPQVARVLARDERYGLNARSPEDLATMARAAESLAGVSR